MHIVEHSWQQTEGEGSVEMGGLGRRVQGCRAGAWGGARTECENAPLRYVWAYAELAKIGEHIRLQERAGARELEAGSTQLRLLPCLQLPCCFSLLWVQRRMEPPARASMAALLDCCCACCAVRCCAGDVSHVSTLPSASSTSTTGSRTSTRAAGRREAHHGGPGVAPGRQPAWGWACD